MKMMKKIINIPIITIGLVLLSTIISFVDLTNQQVYYGGFDNPLLSAFSHKDYGHWAGNNAHLLLFGGMTELMLTRRRKRKMYLILAVASIMWIEVVTRLMNNPFIGASGWLAAFPPVCFATGLWYAAKQKRGYGFRRFLGLAASAFGFFQLSSGLCWDITNLSNPDINHLAHLQGYAFGGIVALCMFPAIKKAVTKELEARRKLKLKIAAAKNRVRYA